MPNGMDREANLETCCCESCQVSDTLIEWLLREYTDSSPIESISASVMIPDQRLVQLLDQVKQNQISRCLYHNPLSPMSLFTNHECDRNNFPLQTIRELDENPSEIYIVKFSNNGKMLASGSLNKIVCTYDTATWAVRHRLQKHSGPVGFLAWSPDDSKLISCCWDHKARVWDTQVGIHPIKRN